MTDRDLHQNEPLTATISHAQRKPLIDIGTRLAHASMALAFFISYLTSESEYWRLVHVYSGYSLAVVLTFRAIWGCVGPVSARWGVLWRRVTMWRMWVNKFKQGQWLSRNFWVGASSWMLSAAVLCLYAFCSVAIASGWATYNELLGDGGLNDALQDLHEGLANLALSAVCLHVGLVVVLRIWRGPQSVRPMWRGYANTSG